MPAALCFDWWNDSSVFNVDLRLLSTLFLGLEKSNWKSLFTPTDLPQTSESKLLENSGVWVPRCISPPARSSADGQFEELHK